MLLYLLKWKSTICEKNHALLMVKILKCIYIVEPTDRFIYEHIIHIDLWF